MQLTKQLVKTWNVDVNSLKHLNYYEERGFDVSEYKIPLLEKLKIEKSARAGEIPMDDPSLSNPINLDKLAPFLAAPRDPGCELVYTMTKSLLFGKKKRIEELATAQIVYGVVVQANNSLWNPGEYWYLPAVIVYATDDVHKYDIPWLRNVASEISTLKKSDQVPEDMQYLIKKLRNDQSIFNLRIGASVAGDADAWCAVHKFPSQKELPRKCLPSAGIVPFLLQPWTEKSVVIGELVPAKFYS